MAEQEACAELVEKASDEATIKDSGSTVHGESLLLPLLQGLLDKPEADQPADSGTESGEDLRSGLVLEVQSALDKLTASLKSPATNISEERRDSLLQLVNRLQTGLSCQLTPSSSSSSERRSSLNQGRFSKRKQRANRHTVGVTTEELEDARRLMEEIAFHESMSNVNEAKDSVPLQKQHSEGSVLQTQPFKPLSKAKTVQNVTAKPFISSNVTSQSQSETSSTVDTPTETSGSLEFLLSSSEKLKDENPPPTYHHSQSLESHRPQFNKKRPLSEAMSLDCTQNVDLIAIQRAVTQAAAIKQLSQLKSDVSEDAVDVQDSETDDDRITVKTSSGEQEIEQAPSHQQSPKTLRQPQPDLIMQTNPVYNQPVEQEENNSDNDEYPAILNEKANRFNNKKLKMKRANTIDIPKPLKYYECDEDDESDNEDLNNRRNSYLALRGPIRVGKSNIEKKVPEFEPKTESDRKFMAFLGKHCDNTKSTNNNHKPALWNNNQQNNKISSNWSSKFGNVKTNFEKVQTSSSVNSARNFWKSADDTVSAGKVSHIGPKISRQSARNLQQMFEEKQKQSQRATTPVNESNVVTGYLKVDTKSNKNIKVMTQPNAINQFSHAPMSAFKPVAKKIEPPPKQPVLLKPKPLNIIDLNSNDQKHENKTPDSPLYLYSPKQVSPNDTSPVNFTPWYAGRTGEGRVLSLAASKFENTAQEKNDSNFIPARRMSKEKIAIPPGLIQQQQQTQPQEKLTAPYLVKSAAQNSSVRKLSGQYDSMGNKDTQNGVNMKHEHDRSKIFLPGENYTIKYNNPAVTKPQPKIYNAEYTITQRYNTPQRINDTQKNLQFKHQGDNQQQLHDQAHLHNQYQQQQLHNRLHLTQSEHTDKYQPYTQPEVYTDATKYEDDHQYTSSIQFKPQIQSKPVRRSGSIEYKERRMSRENDVTGNLRNDYYTHFASDIDRGETEKVFANETRSPDLGTACNQVNSVAYERQTSQESVHEYTPISSKVMSGPVSQQAVTVQQNSPKNRDQHEMEHHLKTSLQKFSSQSQYERKEQYPKSPILRRKSPEQKTSLREKGSPPLVVYNNVKQRPSLRVNDKPLSLESLEVNERGETVLTSKFHIPVKQASPPKPSTHELSKSESWHQICQSSNQSPSKPSPRASPNSRPVSRSKSSHTLAVPKQFEAGMTKSEMLEKKKTMEAYFGTSTQAQTKTESKKISSSINRVKTSQKVSTQRQNSIGLCRSKTLPDIVCLDKLDDSNVDAIFEDIFNSST